MQKRTDRERAGKKFQLRSNLFVDYGDQTILQELNIILKLADWSF